MKTPALFLAFAVAPVASAQFASSVVAYDPGTAAANTDPANALGQPTRFTTGGFEDGAVTPFFPSNGPDETVTVGRGGSLTLALNTPATDDPAHPFGIDLLVFGNHGFQDADFPNGVSAGVGFFAEPGAIEVSADGVTFVEVPDVFADATPFPTAGFTDVAATTESNFRLPVDPSYDSVGDTLPDILAAYAGSGGGTGVDLASVGLTEARFVRFSLAADAPNADFEIDAVSVVPEPATLAALAFPALLLRRRR